MNVHPYQKMFFLALPTLDQALGSRLCRKNKLNRTDLICLIAANIFFEDAKFSTKSLLAELTPWGHGKSLRVMQERFNVLVRAGFIEQTQGPTFAGLNARMPALYKLTSTGKYVIRDFSGKLKEAVRKLERV